MSKNKRIIIITIVLLGVMLLNLYGCRENQNSAAGETFLQESRNQDTEEPTLVTDIESGIEQSVPSIAEGTKTTESVAEETDKATGSVTNETEDTDKITEQMTEETKDSDITTTESESGSTNELETKSSDPVTEYQTDHVNIVIPELKKDYRFIFISDMHIIVESDEIQEEYNQTVSERHELFQNESGQYAQEMWLSLAGILDDYHADAILLGGDIIDFASASNIQALQDGLSKINTPVMYVRADHDYASWYTDISDASIQELHQNIAVNDDIYSMDFDEFLVIGINNNTSQMLSQALEKLKSLFAQGKPVVLVMHVPLASELNDDLYNLSKQIWGDRALIWGENCAYVPDQVTSQFLEMVYAKDSPVVQVLSGHLHFENEALLTDHVAQKVFDASYKGTFGIVNVTGEQ